MIVSTSTKGQFQLKSAAEKVAQDFNCRFIKRYKLSVEELLDKHGEEELLLVTTTGLKYIHRKALEHPFFFHPSSAVFRIKRLVRGEIDPFIEATQLQPGDCFLDCTLGYGADALVAAYKVGHIGKVIGIEANRLMAYIVREGLRTWHTEQTELIEAMQRIIVSNADHHHFLQRQADKSLDVIYFDPMFQQAVDASTHMLPLRHLATHGSILLETIEEAKRVARKRVVYKDSAYSPHFARLGFTPQKRKNASHWYGVIEDVL